MDKLSTYLMENAKPLVKHYVDGHHSAEGAPKFPLSGDNWEKDYEKHKAMTKPFRVSVMAHSIEHAKTEAIKKIKAHPSYGKGTIDRNHIRAYKEDKLGKNYEKHPAGKQLEAEFSKHHIKD